MSGSMGLEATLKNFLVAEEMSVDFFAALLDGAISASRLRLALNGQRDFEHEHYAPIQRTLDGLQELIREHQPVPIRWNNPKLFRTLLDTDRRNRSCTVAPGSERGAAG